jgi:hypothetical protein
VSPSDRFSYESSFDKYSDYGDYVECMLLFFSPKTVVSDKLISSSSTVNQIENLIQLTRLSRSEIITLWNIVDITGTQRFNKEQFIWFLHIVNVRRKASKMPTGLPLRLKEKILDAEGKSAPVPSMYVRPKADTAGQKSIKELEQELVKLQEEIDASRKADKSTTSSSGSTMSAPRETTLSTQDLDRVNIELSEWLTYQTKQNTALKSEIGVLEEKWSVLNSGLHTLSSLQAKVAAESARVGNQATLATGSNRDIDLSAEDVKNLREDLKALEDLKTRMNKEYDDVRVKIAKARTAS